MPWIAIVPIIPPADDPGYTIERCLDSLRQTADVWRGWVTGAHRLARARKGGRP